MTGKPARSGGVIADLETWKSVLPRPSQLQCRITLPPDEGAARRLVIEKDCFTICDDVLYFIDTGPQHRLRVTVPKLLQCQLMEVNHSEPVGGHLAGKGSKCSATGGWDGEQDTPVLQELLDPCCLPES